MIFLIMALVILTFMVIWNFDLHKAVYAKLLSQNAGDGAALAAARWQGVALNLIGDLNIMQAVALTRGDTNTAAGIAELQARLCYVGPMVGLVAAQQAAKNNGVFNNDRFTEKLIEHAQLVRTGYPSLGGDGEMLFREPYPNAWQEYSDMIMVVAEQGVAAAPDNARYYTDYISYNHVLLRRDFYDAVATKDWCWFYHNAYELLLTYETYEDWPPLPPRIGQVSPMNCEYFGVGLAKRDVISDEQTVGMMEQLRVDRNLSPDPIPATVGSVTSSWYCFDGGLWAPWGVMSTNDGFPVAAALKPQYDYQGADSVIRVVTTVSRFSPSTGGGAMEWSARSATNSVVWTAAAKPFGYLDDNSERINPTTSYLVLPSFHDLRMFPVDASTGGAGGAFDLGWRDHIEGHLPPYIQSGPSALVAGCYYCNQLCFTDPNGYPKWENPVYREEGRDWLDVSANRASCDVVSGPGGGGGGGGGGTRRGH